MSPAQVLIADDERDLVWAMSHSLRDEGYEILTACDGEEALEVAKRSHPDVVVLDIVMPRMDGYQVCSRLRRDPELAATPVLFLTARGAIADRVRGLDGGADDYLVKPFDLRELKARVRALLRRVVTPEPHEENGASQGYLKTGALVLDLKTRQVEVDGRRIQLTPSEFDLLHFLMMHPDQTFSSSDLLKRVWGDSGPSVDSSLVRWHIKNLRGKLESDPNRPRYMCTIPHQGYILAIHRSQGK